MGTDRQAFADEIFLGQAIVATSNLSPAVAEFYNEDVVQYGFDMDRPAKSSMKLAGLKAAMVSARRTAFAPSSP